MREFVAVFSVKGAIHLSLLLLLTPFLDFQKTVNVVVTYVTIITVLECDVAVMTIIKGCAVAEIGLDV